MAAYFTKPRRWTSNPTTPRDSPSHGPAWGYPSQGAGSVPSDNSARSQRGVLEDWNDARGFGFITPAGGGSRVFVHVSAFPRGPRPAPRL
ncbi:cold shock domain-containing protein [Segeticoccus rhizosphaerae]|uniref:cold shock domain-containing protein n=1 Tax=Segeticoccus rhizosphaerae TaxID=1104777 RepID=UPI0010C0B9D1